MRCATNIAMGVRLALLETGGTTALVFESARATRCEHPPPCPTPYPPHQPLPHLHPTPQSGARSMWRATNITMGVRLALIEPGGTTALVFESARATRCKQHPQDFLKGKTTALPSDPIADITVREIPLDNTLLASAVSGSGGR